MIEYEKTGRKIRITVVMLLVIAVVEISVVHVEENERLAIKSQDPK